MLVDQPFRERSLHSTPGKREGDHSHIHINNNSHSQRNWTDHREPGTWYSRKSPFYRNQNIYHACLDLLSLPSQVYGTAGQRGGSITTGTKAAILCGLSGGPVALITRGISGGPAAAGAVSTFCVGYAAGELIVDPLLHDVAPSVFPE